MSTRRRKTPATKRKPARRTTPKVEPVTTPGTEPERTYADRMAERLGLAGFGREETAFLLRVVGHRLFVEGTAREQSPAAPGAAPDADVFRAAMEIVELSEYSFTFEGEVCPDPARILREALRCASEDLETVGNADTEISSSIAERAQRRIDLALKLFSFRNRFGGKPWGVDVGPKAVQP